MKPQSVQSRHLDTPTVILSRMDDTRVHYVRNGVPEAPQVQQPDPLSGWWRKPLTALIIVGFVFLLIALTGDHKAHSSGQPVNTRASQAVAPVAASPSKRTFPPVYIQGEADERVGVISVDAPQGLTSGGSARNVKYAAVDALHHVLKTSIQTGKADAAEVTVRALLQDEYGNEKDQKVLTVFVHGYVLRQVNWATSYSLHWTRFSTLEYVSPALAQFDW